MAIECKHGQLARSCELCEWERDEAEYKARIAELYSENQRLSDSIFAGESVYKRKLAKIQAHVNRQKEAMSVLDCERELRALHRTIED